MTKNLEKLYIQNQKNPMKNRPELLAGANADSSSSAPPTQQHPCALAYQIQARIDQELARLEDICTRDPDLQQHANPEGYRES